MLKTYVNTDTDCWKFLCTPATPVTAVTPVEIPEILQNYFQKQYFQEKIETLLYEH